MMQQERIKKEAKLVVDVLTHEAIKNVDMSVVRGD